jgi:hypothetical protein
VSAGTHGLQQGEFVGRLLARMPVADLELGGQRSDPIRRPAALRACLTDGICCWDGLEPCALTEYA